MCPCLAGAVLAVLLGSGVFLLWVAPGFLVGGASSAPWDCVSLFCWWGRVCPCWWSFRCSLGLCVPVLLVGPRVSLLVEPQVLLGTVCPCVVGGAESVPVGGASGAPWDCVSLFCWWGRECPCWWSLRCSLGLCVPVLLVGPCVPLSVEPQVLLGTVGPCFLLVELQVLLGTVCPLFCCILIELQVIVGDRVSLCVVGRGSRVSLLFPPTGCSRADTLLNVHFVLFFTVFPASRQCCPGGGGGAGTTVSSSDVFCLCPFALVFTVFFALSHFFLCTICIFHWFLQCFQAS